MKILVIATLIASGMLYACSGGREVANNYNEHEMRYYSTGDSLRKYKTIEFIENTLSGDTIFNDYINLDYKPFRKKYSLSHSDMDRIAQSMTQTYKLAKTMKAIQDNLKRIEDMRIEPLEFDSTRFSFSKIIKLDTSMIIRTDTIQDSSVYKIMLEFDEAHPIDTLK